MIDRIRKVGSRSGLITSIVIDGNLCDTLRQKLPCPLEIPWAIRYINIYVPNIEAPAKCIKKILTNIKAETDNTIIAEDFNTPLTSMDRSFRQKTSKEILALNDTCD